MSRLWEDYARDVYPFDDIVVTLRGRLILDTLREALDRSAKTALVVVGAGFTSYPWLVDFPVALEADLPHMIAAKEARRAQLEAEGVIDRRNVRHLAVDLDEPGGPHPVA